MTSADFQDRFLSRAVLASLNLNNLATDLIDQLEAYYRLLRLWNRRINLSALELEPLSAAAIDRLLVEPLAAASHLPGDRLVWFDLGSGGGSPAIPLKLARPAARLTMIEARSRKAAFLREVVRELRLSDAEVLGERFETVAGRPDLTNPASCITARGVRIDSVFLDVVDRLLDQGGRVLLFGGVLPDEWQDERFSVVEAVTLLQSDSQSRLVVMARRG